MDPNTPKRDNTTPSCAVCQRRKVKCNRVYPCAPCQKTGLECTFKPPTTRHRHKRLKRSADDDGEDGEHQTTLGAASHTSPATSLERRRSEQHETPSQASAPNTARLVSHGGGYRYVNNHLWSSLSAPNLIDSPAATATEGSTPSTLPAVALPTPEGQSGDINYESAAPTGVDFATGRSFIFGNSQVDSGPSSRDANTALQPQPAHIIQLWQTYLTNVDPMMKVFHAPSVQQIVLGQIGNPSPPANERALVSSIYFISIVSLTDQECRTTFQESRSDLLIKFRQLTEDALSAAGFVTTTDIVILRALLLYLASLRSLGFAQTVWTMTGLAIRIAGTMGLARDGSVLDLPPFESEMRRRLWWSIIYLDARTAELVGQDGDLLVQKYDSNVPSNLNDSELFPSMSRLPDDRPAATEMVYVQLRATIGKTLRAMPGASGPAGAWQRMRAPGVPISEKAEVLNGLEKMFHDQILKYCDASVPLQFLTMNSAQTLLTKMRLMAKIPVVQESGIRAPNDEYSDNTFELSMRLTQLQLDLWTEPGVQRWRWFWQGQFQWYGLACLIRQTRLRKDGPAAMKGWAVIRKVFDIIIPFLELGPRKSPLLEAIQALLNAGGGAQDQSRSRQKDASAKPEVAAFSPINPQRTPIQHGFSTGMGAPPFSALLPGMSSDPPPTVEHDDTHVFDGLDDPAFGWDFNLMDLEEFDRLTAELCGP